jgi:hypothetical protein
LFASAAVAINNGLYQLWDANSSVTELNKLLKTYPNIRDTHVRAQFSGEWVESGNKRLRYITEKILLRRCYSDLVRLMLLLFYDNGLGEYLVW